MTSPRRAATAVTAAVAVWSVLALGGLLWQNPFQVATTAATTTGGWSPEQVRFDRGHYGFRLLYSVSTAQLIVTTASGEIPVYVELVHVPLRGWSLRHFEASPARRAAANHV